MRPHGHQPQDTASAALVLLALIASVGAAGCRRAGQPPAPFSLPPASDAADFVKTAESLENPRYQYLYLGLGGLGVLIGPDGTNSEIVETNAPEPGIFPAEHWSGTSRVGDFALRGELASGPTDGPPRERNITDFGQRLEIRRGIATTVYSDRVGRRDVHSRVTSFVTPRGLLVCRMEDRVRGRYGGLHRRIELEGEGRPESTGNRLPAPSMVVRTGSSRAVAVCVLSRPAAEGGIFPLQAPEGTLTAVVLATAPPDTGALAAAQQRALEAKDEGFDALQQRTAAWWEDFWAASAVTLPDEDLSTWYTRSLYYLAAMTAGADSPPGPMGPLRLRWGGRIFAHDLTYMHYALLTSNHIEEAAQIAEWYHRVLPAARANAEQGYGLPGARYGWEQNAKGKEAAGRPFSEAHHVNGEVALQAYMQALWGAPENEAALSRAREILQATTRFLCEHMVWDQSLQARMSPESTDLDENARLIRGGVSTQMATKWCLEACRELRVPVWRGLPARDSTGEDASAPEEVRRRIYVPSAQWKGREVVVVHAADSPERKMKHPAPLVGVWWWPVLDPRSALARATYENVLTRVELDRTPTFNRPWLAAAAARMGRGSEALRLLEELLEAEGAIVDDTCFAEGHGNRWTYFLTTCGALVSAVNEMLLQSYERGAIRVLPALPESWRDGPVGFERLRARGGILVTAHYEPDELRITLTSPRAASPWVVFPRPAAVAEPVVTVDGEQRPPVKRGPDELEYLALLHPGRPLRIVVNSADTDRALRPL
ncbi:MAG: hypothetical protein PVH68_05390 [Armatimonadota bacterium]